MMSVCRKLQWAIYSRVYRRVLSRVSQRGGIIVGVEFWDWTSTDRTRSWLTWNCSRITRSLCWDSLRHAAYFLCWSVFLETWLLSSRSHDVKRCETLQRCLLWIYRARTFCFAASIYLLPHQLSGGDRGPMGKLYAECFHWRDTHWWPYHSSPF